MSSEGQMSLLNKKISEMQVQKQATVKVYIIDLQGRSCYTKVILEAVHNFNKDYHANLPINSNLYQLYAAKNGNKDTGLPCFQKNQPVQKVGKERFFLQCMASEVRLLSHTSVSSLKSIGIQNEMNVKKKQSGSEKSIFCFCGGW